MKKEISKGTQKFIWHMAAFVAVFVLALVVINKFVPEPSRTADRTHPSRQRPFRKTACRRVMISTLLSESGRSQSDHRTGS